jgi:hypothetical protein
MSKGNLINRSKAFKQELADFLDVLANEKWRDFGIDVYFYDDYEKTVTIRIDSYVDTLRYNAIVAKYGKSEFQVKIKTFKSLEHLIDEISIPTHMALNVRSITMMTFEMYKLYKICKRVNKNKAFL